ncbi:hypothetical protein [Cellulomonas sp. HZM]|uniref:hypothetical protein n=1 Tax=Cellulomonas sp. HZM TaxID=1454010 RepID=UPI0004936D8C|nr:hypothetical protein [Cellulomonas sp. HZM]
MSDETTQEKLAQAKRTATQELFKSGTPDYDPRAQQRAVEAQRKAQLAADDGREGE